MDENKNKNLNSMRPYVITVIIIIAVLFFWFQIRPSIIYSYFNKAASKYATNLFKTKARLSDIPEYKKAAEEGVFMKDDYDYAYKMCLRKYGIYK